MLSDPEKTIFFSDEEALKADYLAIGNIEKIDHDYAKLGQDLETIFN